MDAVTNLLHRAPPVPQTVQVAFAAVGALFLGSKLFSYLRLFLSSFVLGGTNVRRQWFLSRVTLMRWLLT